jgi:hypothetical protein
MNEWISMYVNLLTMTNTCRFVPKFRW